MPSKKRIEPILSLDVHDVPTEGLLVERAELAEALRIVAGVIMRKQVSGASLTFRDGYLFIAAGRAIAKAPARGVWALPTTVGSSRVRRLARSLPPGEPVHVRVENERLYANTYSEPCGWEVEDFPLHPSVRRIANRPILDAAAVLKPFLVRYEDLESLVKQARARGKAQWREQESAMISAVFESLGTTRSVRSRDV